MTLTCTISTTLTALYTIALAKVLHQLQSFLAYVAPAKGLSQPQSLDASPVPLPSDTIKHVKLATRYDNQITLDQRRLIFVGK